MSRRSELLHAARLDWRGAGGSGRALLIGATAILFYEWSAGNETFTTLLITGLLREHRSVPGVLVAGVLAATLIFAEQLLSGLVFLSAVHRLPNLVATTAVAVRERFDKVVPRYRELRWPTRIGISFVMGTSFVAVEDALAGEANRRRSIVLSALTTGATVFAITGVIGGGLIVAQGTFMERPMEIVYSIAGDWRFWLAVVLLPPLVGAVVRRVRDRSSSGQASVATSDVAVTSPASSDPVASGVGDTPAGGVSRRAG